MRRPVPPLSKVMLLFELLVDVNVPFALRVWSPMLKLPLFSVAWNKVKPPAVMLKLPLFVTGTWIVALCTGAFTLKFAEAPLRK